MTTDVDVSNFREHLTLVDCKRLLHHGHVIPICHGYTAEFVVAHYPGWTWNQLVEVFVAAGIFVNRGGAPATCDNRVAMFHFSGKAEFLVEWVGGMEPEDMAIKRRAADRTTGQYEIDAGNGARVFTLGGVDPEA
ncbi:MAG: hypothetical protein ABI862_20580 [Ilumatobacteraceae bacterium]